ncbi:MAG: hypothetical protein HY835_12915 [Anaerolineae bacterium]|nr:hypothetical protein [Anaerolineae bacterium]
MKDELKRCLDDLENRIDLDEETALRQAWIEFASGRCQTEIFAPRRSRERPAGIDWPRVPINAALEDLDQMALQQFGLCSDQLARADGSLLNVRCNYGTGILPLLFGARLFLMDEALDTLPTTHPLPDRSSIAKVIEAGIPDLNRGFGERVFAMGEIFTQIARLYPKIGQVVSIYHPDLQGPMDIAELLWGSTIFTAVFDEPGLIHDLLALVTQTYLAFLRKWESIVPFDAEWNPHWGMLFPGKILLRLDSATNFSSKMIEDFSFPYDQQLLDLYPGAVHFCGRGHHFIQSLGMLRGLRAVNISQPELNRMESIYAHTVDHDILLIGLKREAADQALAAGRPLRGKVHCYSS